MIVLLLALVRRKLREAIEWLKLHGQARVLRVHLQKVLAACATQPVVAQRQPPEGLRLIAQPITLTWPVQTYHSAVLLLLETTSCTRLQEQLNLPLEQVPLAQPQEPLTKEQHHLHGLLPQALDAQRLHVLTVHPHAGLCNVHRREATTVLLPEPRLLVVRLAEVFLHREVLARAALHPLEEETSALHLQEAVVGACAQRLPAEVVAV